tara:strand:- start:581 stop:850 length:270 start_codon:yes stop_codon:yes gene_type:complete
MVELNHNVVSFNSDTIVKGGHGVVVGVFVTKVGTGSNKVEFRNGTTASDPVEFTIFTAAQGTYLGINRRFEDGIFADCAGSAEVTVIFK